MKSAIDRLEEEVWTSCITQKAAQDKQTVERWQSDHYAHIKERFIVSPMPSDLNQLMETALDEWQQRENRLISALGMSREQFLDKFEAARASFLQGTNDWKGFIFQTGEAVYAVVKNMDWVNLFSWILPAANPELADRLYATGRIVAAIFYIEMLWKSLNARSVELKNIEACWKLAKRI